MLTEHSPQIVSVSKLRRRSVRTRSKLFLAEGLNLLESGLKQNLIYEIFATKDAANRFESIIQNMPVKLITKRAAQKLSETINPVGLIAVCSLELISLDKLLSRSPQLISVPVNISDPGNTGTIIRTSDAMGIDAVVLAGNTVDPYNGKCLRASTGSIFSLPIAIESNEVTVVKKLKTAGLQIIATVINSSEGLDSVDLSLPTAWLFGNEVYGLSNKLIMAADHRVHIAIRGHAQSLNIVSAASIFLYSSSLAHHI